MLGLNCAAADVDRGRMDFGDVKQIERDAGSDDIGNGIDRADFVEVNFFDGDAMDAGFGFAQPEENGGSGGLRAGAEGRAGDHLEDVREVAMLCWLVADMHAKFRCGDAAADGFLDLEPRAGIEAMQSCEERIGGSPGVEQSADSHVAADPGEGVEVADFHGLTYFSGAEAPRRLKPALLESFAQNLLALFFAEDAEFFAEGGVVGCENCHS